MSFDSDGKYDQRHGAHNRHSHELHHLMCVCVCFALKSVDDGVPFLCVVCSNIISIAHCRSAQRRPAIAIIYHTADVWFCV